MNKQKVIFICMGNSARSQMAEGFLRHIGADHFDVFSAGLEPSPVHPLARKVMEEIGIDIQGQESKSITRYLGKESFHHAIFVCKKAEQNCPHMYPFALKTCSWPFEDPASDSAPLETSVEKFRRVRDQIISKIKEWFEEIKNEAI